jgi:predicted nucleic acid-binding protein
MVTPIKLYLPRIYLDTNILISAILESDNQWKSSHAREYQTNADQIESSRQIFLKWEHRANQLRTPTFAIGEFIGKGSKQFGKSFKEMLDIVDREILTRCKLCETENLCYDQELIPEKMRKEIRLVEIIGKAQVGSEFRYILFLNMAVGRMLSSAGPDIRTDLEDLVMQEIKSYKAPGFEIMLFQKASELANEYRLNLADAFHLFYAQGKVDYLITNDKAFLLRWKEDPMIEKQTEIKVMSSVDFLRLGKKRQYF